MRHLLAVIAPGTDWLRHPRYVTFRGGFQQIVEQGQTRSNALRAEGKAGFIIIDRQLGCKGDRSGVYSAVHPVQSYTVSSLAVIDRPTGRIETGISRQRARMEVEAPDPGSCHHVSGKDVQSMDVQQNVNLFPLDHLGKAAVLSLSCRPEAISQSRRYAGDRGTYFTHSDPSGHHSDNLVGGAGQHAEALHSCCFFADQENAKPPDHSFSRQRTTRPRNDCCHSSPLAARSRIPVSQR